MTTPSPFALLSWLEELGARFVPVTPRSKRPLYHNWQNEPCTALQMQSHLKQGRNVGLLCGIPSNGIVALDIDQHLALFLERNPLFHTTPMVYRAEAPTRGKLLLKVAGKVPPPRKWKPILDKPPFIEWLSTGNHALLPPSIHPDGSPFRMARTDHPLLEITPDEFETMWSLWTEEVSGRRSEARGTALQERGRRSEARGTANNTYQYGESQERKVVPRSSPLDPGSSSAKRIRRDVRAEIKAVFDMVAYARLKTGAPVLRTGDEVRIMGQGGMLIRPDKGIWNTFGDAGDGKTGGDCFDLVAWLEFGVTRVSGERWQTVLRLAAEFAGIPLTEQVVERTPPPTPAVMLPGGRGFSMVDMWQHAEGLEPAWGSWLLTGNLTLIGGVPGVGKSPLLMAMVAGYLRGVWPDGTPVPDTLTDGAVVYCTPEGFSEQTKVLETWGIDREVLQERVAVPALPMPGAPDMPNFSFKLDSPEGKAVLQHYCEEWQPKLIVVDGLRAAMSGDENSSADVDRFFAFMVPLARQFKAVLVVTHHLPKGKIKMSTSGELPDLEWFRGSGHIVASARSAWIVDRPNVHRPDLRRITLVKAATGPQGQTMGYAMNAPADGLTFTTTAPTAPTANKKEEAKQFILEALQAGKATHRELWQRAQAEDMGFSEQTFRDARVELAKAGKIMKEYDSVTPTWHLVPL